MKKILIICLLSAAILLAGCHCGKETAAVTTPAAAAMAANPCAPAHIETVTQSYPPAGVVRLEKMLPAHVNIDAPFDYRIEVTNLTDNDLENVVVSDRVPADLELSATTPEMQKTSDGSLAWNLGTLAPHASRTISARAVAKSPGTLSTCAQITYDCPTCARVAVVQPKLMLTRSAPSDILSCDRLPIKYVIHNTGTGIACSVTVQEKLPAGWQTAQGRDMVSFDIPSLAPGESKEFDAMVDATEPGTYASRATASAANIAPVLSDDSQTIVRKPALAIESAAPAPQFIGRPLAFDITLKNTGSGVAEDAVVVASVPDNVRFVSASAGGNFTHMSPGKVTWNLGSLPPNASKMLSMELASDQPGEVATTATANARCADAVSSSGQTTVSGIPAVLLEVVDAPDPVELGQNVTYTITVTNQGSATDTNIAITCMLENGMEYVSSAGPTKCSFQENKISFEKLASLASLEKAEWKVVVKARSAGDMRFKTSMIDGQLTRPVEETEATTFYK